MNGRVHVDVRRGADRFTTRTPGIVSRHSFSFGAHYDPTNVGYACLVAHNEELVAPGQGFARHPHRDVEIVTWVLEGGLRHEDSQGRNGLVVPGSVQRLSAGSGVLHTERNDAASGSSARFVQMWVRPDESGGDPSYAQHDVGAELASGALVPLAGGAATVTMRNSAARLYGARLGPARSVVLPDAASTHLFVARGRADLEGAGALHEGDAARLSDAGGRRLDAGRDGCELLVWAMAD